MQHDDRTRPRRPSSRSHLQPGEVLQGQYRVESYLGGGSFGTVYRAHDVIIDRKVALKVVKLPAQLNDEQRKQFIDRFQREIQLLAKLSHPNAVAVYGVGVVPDSGTPFMAMELLDGHSLRDELDQVGPMPPERALSLFRSALEALAEAHDQGIIHKDLKPENLFITAPGTPDERLRVVDFGLAHADRAKRLTMQGEMSGTLEYMAPEYVEAQEVSPAVDVYQMGLILVELFTGHPVIHEGKPIARVAAHMDGALPIPNRLLGSPLGPALMDALALDPGDRFPTAGAFLDALDQLDLSALSRLDPSDEPTTLLNVLEREHSGPGAYTQAALSEQHAGQKRRVAGIVVIALAAVGLVGLIIAAIVLTR